MLVSLYTLSARDTQFEHPKPNMEQRKCVTSTACHCMGERIWWCTYVLVLYLILVDGLLNGSDPTVHTKWGVIRGKWSRSARDQRVANFLGIPYALPPVGDLRFKVRNLRSIICNLSVCNILFPLHTRPKLSNNI